MFTLIILIVIIEIIGIIAFVENTAPYWALSIIIAGIVAIRVLFIPSLFEDTLAYCSTHYWNIVFGVIVWLILGILWSFYKWFLYIKKKIRSYRELRPEDDIVAVKSFLGKSVEASYNKEKLITWMIYWPFSMIGFLLYDSIKRLYDWIYDQVSGVYDRITNNLFK